MGTKTHINVKVYTSAACISSIYELMFPAMIDQRIRHFPSLPHFNGSRSRGDEQHSRTASESFGSPPGHVAPPRVSDSYFGFQCNLSELMVLDETENVLRAPFERR